MKAVHLAIDYQKKAFLDYLPPDRSNAFCAAGQTFAQRLAQNGIPTIWIAWGHTKYANAYYPQNRWDGDAKKYQRKIVLNDLPAFLFNSIHPIFEKGHDNAFFEPKRGPSLQSVLGNAFDAVIFSGLNTCACVAFSIEGAISCGRYRCLVALDQLADASDENHEGKNGGDPVWHLETLEESLSKKAYREADMLTRDEILARVQKNSGGPKPAAA